VNILIASPYAIYPDVPHGGGRDLYALIRHLSARHTIRLVCFVDDREAKKTQTMAPFVDDLLLIRPAFTMWGKALRVIQHLLNGQLPRRADRQMRDALSSGWPDVVYCAWPEMGRYLQAVSSETLRVLDEVDVRFIVEQYENLPGTAGRKQEELVACQTADLVVVRSQRDRDVLLQHLPQLLVQVLPPVGHVREYLDIPLGSGIEGRCLFVGALNRRRNREAVIWFVREVWACVLDARPDATLRIVGAHPAHDVLSLERAQGVTVTGYVENLRAEYEAAHIIIAPMQSEAGALNKVLDGLAAGRPVVATTVSNAGIMAPDSTIALADDPETFAVEIVSLLTDADRHRQQAQAGREFVQAAFNWDASAQELEALLCKLVEDKTRIGVPETAADKSMDDVSSEKMHDDDMGASKTHQAV
jgi:glycosyltransferase involved in cell wall biosynthesis